MKYVETKCMRLCCAKFQYLHVSHSFKTIFLSLSSNVALFLLFFYFKLVIYAGPNTNSRKVTEYGGNTLGYGSRSVLGTGWPKDLVKVRKINTHTVACYMDLKWRRSNVCLNIFICYFSVEVEQRQTLHAEIMILFIE